jgi:serine-type D-Ala-D-Ala carboxypeptidase (penicillin-binding protein 5/6)
MLPSGNDAAHLMAEFMGYVLVRARREESFNPEKLGLVDLTRESTAACVAEFVRQMNCRADKLGLTATRFSNPHGLQNAMNISTAKDVLALSVFASKNARFKAIMNAETHRYHQYSGDESRASKSVRVWENTNVLLREGWEGIKTGQTQAAGGCLASLRDGIYIVVLNCPDALRRFTETKRLYEWYTEKARDLHLTLSSE